MKKIKVGLVALLVFCVSISLVNAACTTEETNKLNSLAVNVRASYEVLERELEITDDFNYPDGLSIEEMENYVRKEKYFRIYISNITKELYIKVTDTLSKQTKTYTFDNAKDGVISIDQTNRTAINEYTIEVYSSSETGCPDTKLYTVYLTTPMYNSYSENYLCEGIENFYLCHEYLSVPNVSLSEFTNLATSYKAGQVNEEGNPISPEEEKEEKGLAKFLKENRNIIIVTSVIIVTVGGLVTVIIVKKQRSRIV